MEISGCSSEMVLLAMEVEEVEAEVMESYRSSQLHPHDAQQYAHLCMYSERNNSRKYCGNDNRYIEVAVCGGGCCPCKSCRRTVTFLVLIPQIYALCMSEMTLEVKESGRDILNARSGSNWGAV